MTTEEERDELAELLATTEYPHLDPPWKERGDRSPVKYYSRKKADAVIAAGYRKIFDGDCGLSNIKDPTDREAAEAWMRWANLVNTGDGEPNGITAMKQMLTELGYRKMP